jgi:hypothetical protein
MVMTGGMVYDFVLPILYNSWPELSPKTQKRHGILQEMNRNRRDGPSMVDFRPSVFAMHSGALSTFALRPSSFQQGGPVTRISSCLPLIKPSFLGEFEIAVSMGPQRTDFVCVEPSFCGMILRHTTLRSAFHKDEPGFFWLNLHQQDSPRLGEIK